VSITLLVPVEEELESPKRFQPLLAATFSEVLVALGPVPLVVGLVPEEFPLNIPPGPAHLG
jgi:hypothetical protein